MKDTPGVPALEGAGRIVSTVANSKLLTDARRAPVTCQSRQNNQDRCKNRGHPYRSITPHQRDRKTWPGDRVRTLLPARGTGRRSTPSLVLFQCNGTTAAA